MKNNELIYFISKFIMFFSVITFAIYYTESSYCLWALLLMPTYSKDED